MWLDAAPRSRLRNAEAAALRRAFPEELGDHPVAEENRYEGDRAPRPLYGRADEPEPQRQLEADREQPGALYEVIDADGEEHSYQTAQATGEALTMIFVDAARRDLAALDAAAENNAATIQQLRTAGHDDLADDLVRQWKGLIKDSDPFGLPPATQQASPPPTAEHPGAASSEGAPPRQGEPSPKPAPLLDEENLTVPLERQPTIPQLEYYARQMLAMIAEKQLTAQRAALIKQRNEGGIGFLKLKAVARYDEVMAALNAKVTA